MPLDPKLLDELARCYMRAALDEYMRILRETPEVGSAGGTGSDPADDGRRDHKTNAA